VYSPEFLSFCYAEKLMLRKQTKQNCFARNKKRAGTTPALSYGLY